MKYHEIKIEQIDPVWPFQLAAMCRRLVASYNLFKTFFLTDLNLNEIMKNFERLLKNRSVLLKVNYGQAEYLWFYTMMYRCMYFK